MKNNLLHYLLIFCISILSFSNVMAYDEVERKEYSVKGKTIIEQKYNYDDGSSHYRYSVQEFTDSIESIKKTRKSVYTKQHVIQWRERSVWDEEVPRVRDLFCEYADTLFSIGDPRNYLYNLDFFIYDTGGIIVQGFSSIYDLIGEYDYGDKILELFEKLQTFRFSTPVVSGFDKDYYIDGVCYGRMKSED